MQNHLDNEDFQKFLDNDITANEKRKYISHLNNCSECRLVLDDYKSIYLALESEEDFRLSINFTQNVVSQLALQKITVKKDRWSDRLFAFAGIVISLLVSIFYLESPEIKPYFTSLDQFFQKLKIISTNIDSIYVDLLINPYLAVFVGIIMVIFILERFVLNKRVPYFI
jgi:hypothetical protein